MTNQHNSSIIIVPPLTLSNFQNHPSHQKNQHPSKLKQRVSSRYTLADFCQLQTITEEQTDRYSIGSYRPQTERSCITLSQLRTLKKLRTSELEGLTQQECLQKLANDLFFRKKIQCQLKSISKSSSAVDLGSVDENNICRIEKTMKLIQIQGATTFRKMKQKQNDEMMKLRQKYSCLLQNAMKKIRSTKQNFK